MLDMLHQGHSHPPEGPCDLVQAPLLPLASRLSQAAPWYKTSILGTGRPLYLTCPPSLRCLVEAPSFFQAVCSLFGVSYEDIKYTCAVTIPVYFEAATIGVRKTRPSHLDFLQSFGELIGLQLSQDFLKLEINYAHGLPFCLLSHSL